MSGKTLDIAALAMAAATDESKAELVRALSDEQVEAALLTIPAMLRKPVESILRKLRRADYGSVESVTVNPDGTVTAIIRPNWGATVKMKDGTSWGAPLGKYIQTDKGEEWPIFKGPDGQTFRFEAGIRACDANGKARTR